MSKKTTPQSNSSSSDSLYLGQLKFTPKDNKSFLKFFLDNFRVVILLIIAILIWGIVSFNMLPLESSPEVKIPYGVVTISLPGASPADMEELVIKKIEPEIAGLKGLKTMKATALNSFATITAEFNANQNLNDSIRRLRDAVNKAKPNLPSEASDPQVTQVSFSNTPIWTLVLSGPYDGFTLRKYADDLKDQLDKLPGTSKVMVSGGDITEIALDFNPKKLQAYGLSMNQVIGQIKAANLSLPLGMINIGNYQYALKINGKTNTIDDIRALPITTSTGTIIKLTDVTNVIEKAQDNKVINRFSAKGGELQNAVTINVIKKTGYSIIDLINQGKNKLKILQQTEFPQNLKAATILDISKQIGSDFGDLIRDAIITIILVFFVLLLFVGLKEALVAGLVIPLVFSSTFGFMVLFGITLNFLSLFSLIMSLGFLVDDAIVVVQATKRYLSTGKFTPEEAILLVFRDFKNLLITTALTTMFSFIPLLLATGIIGSFIRSIPITVSMTIFSSMLIAIFINHTMGAVLERFRLTTVWFKSFMAILGIILLLSLISLIFSVTVGNVIMSVVLILILFILFFRYHSGLKEKLIQNEQLQLEELADPAKIKARIRHHYIDSKANRTLWGKISGGIVSFDKILPAYDKLLNSILNSRFKRILVLTVAVVLFIGAIALPASGILKSEFLSASDQQYMYVNITGAPGLLTNQISKIADQVTKVLRTEPDIKNFSEIIGSAGVNTSKGELGMSNGGGGQTNRAQFAINLYDYNNRPIKKKSYNIAANLRQKLNKIHGAKIELIEIQGGPPAGADFQAQFAGDNLNQLETVVDKYKNILDIIPGTVNEKTSLNLSPGEFTFHVLPEQASARGVTTAQIARALRTAISGTDVTTILRNQDEINVRAQFQKDTVNTIAKLKNITITSQTGQPVKIGEVTNIKIGAALTSIHRVDQKRVITLTAAVTKPYLPTDILTEFKNKIKANPLPKNITITYGGANQTNTDSILSILRAMIVAFILIVSTLVIQFNSFRKAALVLITIPLAITGVFFGFTLIGLTLTFPALIGILALFGIVVKNAIILIDKVNLNLKVGIPYQEAIIDASKSRLEAIFLTSIATVIGMIPLTLTNETWQGLGAALIFGLSTSTILTLVILPTAFYILFKKSAAKDTELSKLKLAVETSSS